MSSLGTRAFLSHFCVFFIGFGHKKRWMDSWQIFKCLLSNLFRFLYLGGTLHPLVYQTVPTHQGNYTSVLCFLAFFCLNTIQYHFSRMVRTHDPCMLCVNLSETVKCLHLLQNELPLFPSLEYVYWIEVLQGYLSMMG